MNMNHQSMIPRAFEYDGKTVRTAGTSDAPLFCAKDVCEILGLDTSQLRRLDDDERVLRPMQTPGGSQDLAFVTEAGLYSLILGSRKPEARPFKRWVTREVIPAIRKTGQYAINKTRAELLLEQAQALVEQERRTAELERRLVAVEAHQSREAVDYYTVIAFCNIRGIACDLKLAARIGARATSLARQAGAIIGSVPDPRFGRVNTYHHEFLELAAEELGLATAQGGNQ